MSNLTEFFLSGSRGDVQLELIEISHPNFSQVYRKVRNARKGVTVTLEDASTKTFDYLPMKITNDGSRDDMDSGVSVTFGDLGETLPKELDLVKRDDGFKFKPKIRYWVYKSSDLTAPLYGPLSFEAKSFSFKRQGATFQAKAPQLNYSATGLLYRIDTFPMLRGAL